MELPNIHFQDFPIEFKEINPEDFPHFEVDEKINLTLENGYIGDSFLQNINLDEKNTVILNCGVGSGKTTAIINTIKHLYEDPTTVIFIASPYLSLVQQYYLDVQEKSNIPESDIYRHEWIGESSIPFTSRRIHIITINALLGNPGENSQLNSNHKRQYLNSMVSYCETNDKKVVFIYDEIHDSIHNFREKLIFNLWKWRNVIHKNFIISATFNEASKVVIEYLAELTDKKIQILEAERKCIPSKQSKLYLYFDNATNYTNDNGNLINIIENTLNKEMDIDILCYSKKLCKSIIKNKQEGAGKLLYDKYGDNINDCTSGLVDNSRVNRDYNKGRFNNEKCNIGTNFISGISIEKENHAFILILPPVITKGDFKSSYGIFSGGINTIIQGLARKRKVGEIHIILPKPTNFDFESFPFNKTQKLKFKKFFEPLQYQKTRSSENGITDTKRIEWTSLNNQNSLLQDYYSNELKANVEDCIEYVSANSKNRTDLVRLQFPEYKLFKLENGEDYLTSKYKFLGLDLSGYICYAAATNQFVNCSWNGSNIKPIQNFKINKLQYLFEKFFKDYFNEDWVNSLISNVSNFYSYFEIRNSIFNEFRVKFYDSNNDYIYLRPFENKQFETQLIAFIQRKLYRNNKDFTSKYTDSNGYFEDFPFTRGDYFRNCISHAIAIEEVPENLSLDTKELIIAYQIMNDFRSRMFLSRQNVIVKKENLSVISNSPKNTFFSESDCQSFEFMINTLINKDIMISNEIFDFKNSFIRNENESIEKKIKTFYNYLKTDMFESFQKKIKNKQLKGNFAVITKINEIPNSKDVLNLIFPAEILIPEENINSL